MVSTQTGKRLPRPVADDPLLGFFLRDKQGSVSVLLEGKLSAPWSACESLLLASQSVKANNEALVKSSLRSVFQSR
jgi:hypothetical protein